MTLHTSLRAEVKQPRGRERPRRPRAPERRGRDESAPVKARTHIPGFHADATPC